jgi:hypothetical protein
MKQLVIAIITGTMFALFLFGCGPIYESRLKEMLKTATYEDFGPPPPDNYQEMETEIIRHSLKDPDSAQIKFGDLGRSAIPSGSSSLTPMLIWRNDVLVNAKNSFGGYGGFQPYHFAWRDGRLIAVSFPFEDFPRVYDGLWTYLE